MSSNRRVPLRSVMALLPAIAFGSCASLGGEPHGEAAERAAESRATALHVLDRLTFGPRPGDVERVLRTGVGRWIAMQLQPERIDDAAAADALGPCALWTLPPDSALKIVNAPTAMTMQDGSTALVRLLFFTQFITRDSVDRLGARGATQLRTSRVVGCRLARMETSEQQLLEVMTDFWHNHFSVYGGSLSVGTLVAYDRKVIRPHALGRFRDLLGAVAKSTAMLTYLDNDTNGPAAGRPSLKEVTFARVSGRPPSVDRHSALNENFARELMELHTLGVDGGYTQQDVIDVARAFSGWTHSGACPGQAFGNGVLCRRPNDSRAAFVFDPALHDAGPKLVLGRTLAAERSTEDGEEVLDMLASHPSTARSIARKLAIRFVSDAPPDDLVRRATDTYMRTNGDIREVVRTIVTSREFFAPDVRGSKIKSPLELVLSTRRALGAHVDSLADTIDHLIQLYQPPYGKLTPDGWPETGSAWMTVPGVIARSNFAIRVGYGETAAIPLEAWPASHTLARQPFEAQVDGVIDSLLQGRASTALRAALLASRPPTDDPESATSRMQTLRHIVALAIGSPEFQRR